MGAPGRAAKAARNTARVRGKGFGSGPASHPTTVGTVLNGALMVLLALVTIFPFYYVVLIALSDYATVHKQILYIFPTKINFESFRAVFEERTFLNSFLNSVFVTVVGTAYSLLISSMAAYALSKDRVPGHRILFIIAIIPMFFSGGLIPYYLTVSAVGLSNSIWVMVIPAAITTFYLLLMKNSFDDVPKSLEESAKIDGATDFTVFFRIVLPTSMPVIATMALFYAVDKWNDYYLAMLFINDLNKYPLQMTLREILNNFTRFQGTGIGAVIQNQQTPIVYTRSLQMAVIVVATVPILCVYPFLQKHFTKGIMLGAVKE